MTGDALTRLEGSADGDLGELIARLEAAVGPDRELADAVLLACGWVKHKNPVWNHLDRCDWLSPPPRQRLWSSSRRPNPTASIDAALTLVPEGFAWMVRGSGADDIAHPFFVAYVTIPGHDVASRVGATAPLALCIAALKARAAEQGRKAPT